MSAALYFIDIYVNKRNGVKYGSLLKTTRKYVYQEMIKRLDINADSCRISLNNYSGRKIYRISEFSSLSVIVWRKCIPPENWRRSINAFYIYESVLHKASGNNKGNLYVHFVAG